MGHHITALIARAPINEEKAAFYDFPFFYEGKYVIVAMDASHADYWDEKLGYKYAKKSEIIMDTACTHFLASELGLSTFAIVSTDYFGGMGSQVAAAYENGKQVLPPTKDGINQALKLIGVKRSFLSDEFDAVGLGKYRDWDDYFEKYQEL